MDKRNREDPMKNASIGEVVAYLRQNDYKFSQKDQETRSILITDKKGSPVAKRIFKRFRDEIQILIADDYERNQLTLAFDSVIWRDGAGGPGRSAMTSDEYTLKLAAGVNSNGAGLLAINVGLLYDLEKEKRQNRKGEKVEVTLPANFAVAFDKKAKTLTIKKK
jgi:hypothetical protein